MAERHNHSIKLPSKEVVKASELGVSSLFTRYRRVFINLIWALQRSI